MYQYEDKKQTITITKCDPTKKEAYGLYRGSNVMFLLTFQIKGQQSRTGAPVKEIVVDQAELSKLAKGLLDFSKEKEWSIVPSDAGITMTSNTDDIVQIEFGWGTRTTFRNGFKRVFSNPGRAESAWVPQRRRLNKAADSQIAEHKDDEMVSIGLLIYLILSVLYIRFV